MSTSIYLYETYKTFFYLFLLGWILYVVSLVVIGIFVYETKNKYKASMRYYYIIISTLLFIVGLIGTIFLPSTDAMKLFLGLK